jgi:hypothetical protein
VKPTRQPGKNKQALKKTASVCCIGVRHNKNYLIAKEINNKV